MEKEIEESVTSSILLAGQMLGLSLNLDADLLEQWLNERDKSDGFKFEDQCRAAIEFKRRAFPNEL